jgi:hypothetical protein
MTESKLQQNCITWFRYAYPEHKLFLWSVPNGGRRDARTGAMMKKEGALAGVPDLVLCHPAGNKLPMFLELKLPKGRLSYAQKEFQKAYAEVDYPYFIIRSLDDFVQAVSLYLKNIV